ncbi:MAG: hypothetical protein QW559_01870 [Candidatus Woesearchaeota archaeon]
MKKEGTKCFLILSILLVLLAGCGGGGGAALSISHVGQAFVGEKVDILGSYQGDLPGGIASWSCNLFVDGSDKGRMELTMSGGITTARTQYTFTTPGTHTLQIKCKGPNQEAGSSQSSITILLDTEPPTVAIAQYPSEVLVYETVHVSGSYSDNSGVTSCNLFVNGADTGRIKLSSYAEKTGAAYGSYVATKVGTNTLQLKCEDGSGNEGMSSQVTIEILPDLVPPSLTIVHKPESLVDETVYVSGTYSDNSGVTSCNLFVDGANKGVMSLKGDKKAGTAQGSYVFTMPGNHTFQIKCKDLSGNEGASVLSTIKISFPELDSYRGDPQLDSKRQMCKRATEVFKFISTGTKCCGGDDAGEYYNDPYYQEPGYENSGGCWNSGVKYSGVYDIAGGKVAVINGSFHGCSIDQTIAAIRDTHTGSQLVINSTLCEAFFDAPSKTWLTCNVSGAWKLGKAVKSNITWPPAKGETSFGCCPENECWDGTRCVRLNTIKKTGVGAFVCTAEGFVRQG